MNTNIRTIVRVPRQLRTMVAKVWTSTIRDIVEHNDDYSWKRLFMFKAVLEMPERGGKGGNRFVAFIRRHLEVWQSPQWMDVWRQAGERDMKRRSKAERRENPPKISSEKQLANNIKRAKRLMNLGETSNAARALMSCGVAPSCDETIDELRKKHPAQPKCTLQENERVEVLKAKEKTIRAMASRFNRSSSGGLDGLTAQHFLDIISEDSATGVLSSLTELVNLVLSGMIFEGARPFFFGARLIGINKKSGGIRPIAIGGILRRLVGKVVTHLTEREAAQFCGHRQLGIGTKGGCEILASSFGKFLRYVNSNEDICLLKIDFQNAFNMCNRQQFLDFINNEYPQLYPFAVSMLAEESYLKCANGASIKSSGGFQQGCPTSPMFFSLFLEYFLSLHADKLSSLEFDAFYLDDGTVGGSVGSVGEIFQLLLTDGPQFGLIVNKSKCELVVNAQRGKIEWASDIRIVSDGNIDIVGVPFGSSEFIKEHVSKQLDELETFCERIRKLNDPQYAFLLLSQHAAICKVNFFMRTVPPEKLSASMKRYDRLINTTMEFIIGCPLSNSQYTLSSLAFRNGGLGMRNANQISCAAFLGSQGLVARSKAELIKGEACGFHDIAEDHSMMEAIQLFNSKVHPKDSVDQDTPPYLLSQHRLTEAVEKKQFDDIMAQSSVRDKAHLLGTSAKGSSGFLRAVPNPWEGGRLDPLQFRCAIQLKVGADIIKDDQRCKECGAKLDNKGDHGLVCSSGTGRIFRHDKVSVALSKLLHEAKQDHVLELTHLTGDNKERPGDIFIENWTNREDIAVDIGIVCPMANSYKTTASKERFSAAKQMFARKDSKYSRKCEGIGFKYLPLVAETTGGWSSESKEFFNTLAGKLACVTGEDIARVKNRIFKRLSIASERSNAIAILNHYRLSS